MEAKLNVPLTGTAEATYSPARLNRLERLLDGSLEQETVSLRRRLLCYCRRYRIAERAGWYEMTAFSEAGAKGLSEHRAPMWLFDTIDRKLRESILRMLLEGAPTRLVDLRDLLQLVERFTERVRFISDILVQLFLARERGGVSWKVVEAQPYLQWYTNKLFREVDAIATSLTDERSLESVAKSYEWWAGEKLLDEEVLV